jgi:hypothetical protein
MMRFSPTAMISGAVIFGLGYLPAQFSPARAVVVPQESTIAQSDPLVYSAGSIDPNEMVKVEVMNDTSLALYAGISGGSRVELAPQGKTTFQFDSTPINVFVYPAITEAILKYETSVTDNTIEVMVTQTSGDPPGDEAINVDPAGDVYIF